ncbi:MAG: MobC family plasmid mobilization relaxosome protein [Kocuria sp.]|nr:MobC family plasmid mobilization relaxosome protein [Kocuria sp.]
MNKEHPTMGEEVLSDEHLSHVGDDSVADGVSDNRRSPRRTKETVVSSRLDESGSDDFTFVRSELRMSSSSEAIREIVKIAAAVLRDEKYQDASRAQELRTVDLDENQIASLKESLDRNVTGYADATFQFQKIGNNVNQLARSANSGDRVPAAALKQVSRQLARIEELLLHVADQDGARASTLRRWL